MRIYKDVSVIKKDIKEVICNMCGENIKKDDFDHFYDYLQVDKLWGYTSEYDGENHCFDLCQDCYEKFINSFKIPIDNNNA